MKYVFIINPIAGKKKKQPVFSSAVEEYFGKNGGDYEIYYSKCNGDAGNYAKKIAESGEKVWIFACGGEGTAFEVLNGIIGFDNVSIGVVPCGSANDFITYFSDKKLFFDVENQIKGSEVLLDLIKVGDYYAMNSCSVGMDAMVAANMSKFKRWPLVSGSMAYVFALVYTLFSKLGVKLKLKFDNSDKIIENKSLFAVIANAPFYGGGFYPTPNANPFDGILDFSIVSVVSRFKILSLLKSYREGKHTNFDFCNIGVCNSAVIDAEKEVPLNMDGEIIFTKHAEFEIVKKAVKLILPKSVYDVWLG